VRIDRSDDEASRPDSRDVPLTRRTNAEPAEPIVEPDAAKRIGRTLENRAKVDAAYRAYAIDQGYERIREVECDVVTPTMRRIEAADPGRHLAGLDHRLKGKERLTEKIELTVQRNGYTVAEAFASVKDAIRYTFVYDEAEYTAGVNADCNRLTAEGFRLIERPNSWDKEQYKGINSRWQSSHEGQLFEVQFHTQASLDAKEQTHWAYEKLRAGAPTPAEQKELEEYQKRVTAQIPIPSGAQDIPHYP
jgi:hypothetical protein